MRGLRAQGIASQSNHLRIDIFSTKRTSPCRYHARDPNPNTHLDPNPKDMGISIPMRSPKHAVPAHISQGTSRLSGLLIDPVF